MHQLYKEGICSVIDADALPLASHAFEYPNMAILTPHEGEFSRLFGPIQDRTKAALAASIATQQTLVLKGKNTVIATPSGYSINPTGNANMATAGSGDVLAGLILALLTQGMDPFDAASAGAWLHGADGDGAIDGVASLGVEATERIGELVFWHRHKKLLCHACMGGGAELESRRYQCRGQDQACDYQSTMRPRHQRCLGRMGRMGISRKADTDHNNLLTILKIMKIANHFRVSRESF
jgi:hypothetical protein